MLRSATILTMEKSSEAGDAAAPTAVENTATEISEETTRADSKYGMLLLADSGTKDPAQPKLQ